MKKLLSLLAMILCVCMPACAGETESSTGFSEKGVPVILEGEDVGELTLRFYDETPNVPYLGISAYADFMKLHELTLHEEENGTFVLENEIGEDLVCDPEADVITIADWNRFFDLPLPLEDVARGWKDTSTRFIRILDR